MDVVCFLTMEKCPEEHRPAGVSLAYPWVEEHCKSEEQIRARQAEGYCCVTTEEYERYKKSVSPPIDKTVTALNEAKEFGIRLTEKFSAENIMMGITQAGMTSHVRKSMGEVLSALSTGSLYDAISELRAIPSDEKDLVFLTDERILIAINEIETYLKLPLSESI